MTTVVATLALMTTLSSGPGRSRPESFAVAQENAPAAQRHGPERRRRDPAARQGRSEGAGHRRSGPGVAGPHRGIRT